MEAATAKCSRRRNRALTAPEAPFLFANAGGKGYYRSTYPADVYAKLVANVETGLTPEERISLIGDSGRRCGPTRSPWVRFWIWWRR